MSRTPASYSMQVVRGATWEDEFTYTLQDKVTPVDLTGYRARMQVRSVDGQYGLTNAETLVLPGWGWRWCRGLRLDDRGY